MTAGFELSCGLELEGPALTLLLRPVARAGRWGDLPLLG